MTATSKGPARRGAPKRALGLPPPVPIDRRADLHGHVLDFVGGEDRRWFEQNPGETELVRLAEDHEWCDPRIKDRCVDLLPPVPAGHQLVVFVRYIGPGVRCKRPVFRELDR